MLGVCSEIQLDFLADTGIQITDKSMMVTTNQKMRLGMSLNMLNSVFAEAEVTNGTVKKASA
jgi:hypothetical protein